MSAVDNFITEYETDLKARRKKVPSAKAALLSVLRRTLAHTVVITYDGEGDSGQIEEVAAWSRKRRPVKLIQPVTLDLDGTPTHYATVAEALDAFAWAVLDAHHGGFENNDGGFGTLTINVRSGKVILDHNDRITDVANSVTEV